MNMDLNQEKMVLQLDYLQAIKIDGRDAIGFLNDQFTNDITALKPGVWQYNGYCSSKGRLIALFRLFVHEDCVYIVLPKRMSDPLIKRLQVYVFRSKVNIDPMTDHRIYCMMGTAANQNLNTLDKHAYRQDQDGFIINASINTDRYLVISKSSESVSEPHATPPEKSEQLWRLSEIRDGVANIDVETSGLFIPQHVNLDKLDGISFKKGCFPGQEVVARLHYLGKAKQTMKPLDIESKQPITPGETLNHPDYRKALRIVDAVKTGDQRYELLAVGQFD